MKGRPQPELVATLRFESEGRLQLVCFSDHDEARLRAWLVANPHATLDLVAALLAFLNDLLYADAGREAELEQRRQDDAGAA